MIFRCRNCGETTADIDTILDGACRCGSTSFQLVSETRTVYDDNISLKEAIRRDLHLWLDLNIDAVNPEDLTCLRVKFEMERPADRLQKPPQPGTG
ncbi:MAG: hypothetical protein QXS20_08965 [Candidatus Thorarchaeota archaeon]